MDEPAEEPPGRRIVESLRRFNRHPTLLRVTQRTRERTMGDGELADPLTVARGRPADLAAQHLVTARGDSPGVLGELGLATLQAWQRFSESQDRGRGKVDIAILFTDLVGFSSWALEAGDRSAIRLLREFAEATEPSIRDRRGEVVKRLGDGVMAAFWDAPSAAAAAAAFAAAEHTAAIEVDGYRPRLRTGIHLGRPRKIGGDYFGVDVNIAARLAEAAKPGEILVSGRTLEALDTGAVTAKKRRFSAKGTPADLTAHVVTRP